MPRRFRPASHSRHIGPIGQSGPRIVGLGLALAALLAAGAPETARAQFGGSGSRPMGPGMQPGQGGLGPGGQNKEEEQAAEAAPDSEGQEPALQPLPAWPGQREKTLQFFQLNGYIRGRAYLFHQFNLGVPLNMSGVTPPFYVPFSEAPTGMGTNPASCTGREGASCTTTNLTSADMRLRLEPTINVSDQVRVKMQADVFDNLVLGSTPEGYFLNGMKAATNIPVIAFSKGQAAPEIGVNSFESSIRFKRAWAEIRTPIGELRFGRMPSHWGTGMFVNSGDCLDCDYGTNVDRAMFATKLFNHFIALIWDWAATGPTTRLFNPNFQSGPHYNADPLDDVMQFALALGRQDKPEELKEKVERGDLVLNYGGYFVYRRQDWDLSTNPGQGKGGALGGIGTTALTNTLVPRSAWAFIPDLWFRLSYRKLQIEAEGVLIYGKIGHLSDQVAGRSDALTIIQWGGVARFDYKLLHDALHLGMEIGYASGDPSEDPNGSVNYRTGLVLPANTQSRISNFQFDPDYHVDLILFRRILGTVSNATYFKPHAAYDILDNLSARVDVIYSLANVPVGYPGNATNLGLELDGSVMYHNDEEGFYAGVSYGVLFPFAALNFPSTIYNLPAPGYEAQAAQTVQGRIAVKF